VKILDVLAGRPWLSRPCTHRVTCRMSTASIGVALNGPHQMITNLMPVTGQLPTGSSGQQIDVFPDLINNQRYRAARRGKCYQRLADVAVVGP